MAVSATGAPGIHRALGCQCAARGAAERTTPCVRAQAHGRYERRAAPDEILRNREMGAPLRAAWVNYRRLRLALKHQQGVYANVEPVHAPVQVWTGGTARSPHCAE